MAPPYRVILRVKHNISRETHLCASEAGLVTTDVPAAVAAHEADDPELSVIHDESSWTRSWRYQLCWHPRRMAY